MTVTGTVSSAWPGIWQNLKTSTGAWADACVRAFVCVCVYAHGLYQGVRQHAFPVLRWDCSRQSVVGKAHTFCDMHTRSFIIMWTNMVIKASTSQENVSLAEQERHGTWACECEWIHYRNDQKLSTSFLLFFPWVLFIYSTKAVSHFHHTINSEEHLSVSLKSGKHEYQYAPSQMSLETLLLIPAL